MLKNAYLLAKIGADTAENERSFAENLPNIGNYPTGPHPGTPATKDEAERHFCAASLAQVRGSGRRDRVRGRVSKI